MTDLFRVLPDLRPALYVGILPALEKAHISCNDLATIDHVQIAKRAAVHPSAVKRLQEELLKRVLQQNEESSHVGLGFLSKDRICISTLDDALDNRLDGGFPTGYVSEITGESAAGKTQLLLSLCLAVQLPAPRGAARPALYITTEGPLQTSRLLQIISSNPLLATIPLSSQPSLDKIHSVTISDVEAQDHILNYQVPVVVARHNIGLIVIDSVTANFRAEFNLPPKYGIGKGKSRNDVFNERDDQLKRLGAHLRRLAQDHNLAVVVANQILDRIGDTVHSYHDNTAAFGTPDPDAAIAQAGPSQVDVGPRSQTFHTYKVLEQLRSQSLPSASPRVSEADGVQLSTADTLTNDHQQRFTTGWGSLSFHDTSGSEWWHVNYHKNNTKTPSLGNVWTSQLAARIVMLRSPVYGDHDYSLGIRERDVVRWRRWIGVAFAAWARDTNGSLGIEVEIWNGGVRAIGEADEPELDD